MIRQQFMQMINKAVHLASVEHLLSGLTETSKTGTSGPEIHLKNHSKSQNKISAGTKTYPTVYCEAHDLYIIIILDKKSNLIFVQSCCL